MLSTVEKYLETLLAFVPKRKAGRHAVDYVSLIHVPVHGPERVYSLVFDKKSPLLTVARYKETVWEIVERKPVDGESLSPELDALQAEVAADHPVFEYLDTPTLGRCQNHSEGGVGQEYFLMLWQKDGQANVVECYEPHFIQDSSWQTVIDAMQALSGQFEYALQES